MTQGGNDPEDVKIGLAVIWAIGVGSALGGDFFGWQFVLYGGFGSAVMAVIFCGGFYWLYAGVITELAARYKTSGGSFDFVNYALGAKQASIMAVLGLLKLILANSALALAISSYLVSGGMPTHLQPVCWVCTYGFFTYLDSIGVRQSANVQVMATVLCVVILAIYSLSAFTEFSVRNLTQGGNVYIACVVAHTEYCGCCLTENCGYCYSNGAGLFVDGSSGFFQGLPFALQFFDGFEEVPLLMGYASDPEKTIPRAILLCYLTIAAIAGFVLISGSGASPGAELLASEAPLMDGIDLVYGPGNMISDVMAYAIVIGMFVNFFAFVLFVSQQVQAIAEAGQLPAFLAYRHPVHGAPITASVCGSAYGLFLTFGFAVVFGIVGAQDTLVTAALMPAVLQYALLLQCIVRVRNVERLQLTQKLSPRDELRLGSDPRTLRFSYGAFGARVGQVMCAIFVGSLLLLATISIDFFFGIIVLALCGICMYAGMRWSVGKGITLSDHIQLEDDAQQMERLTGEGSHWSHYHSTAENGFQQDGSHPHHYSHGQQYPHTHHASGSSSAKEKDGKTKSSKGSKGSKKGTKSPQNPDAVDSSSNNTSPRTNSNSTSPRMSPRTPTEEQQQFRHHIAPSANPVGGGITEDFNEL
jgi:ethanolamine permease